MAVVGGWFSEGVGAEKTEAHRKDIYEIKRRKKLNFVYCAGVEYPGTRHCSAWCTQSYTHPLILSFSEMVWLSGMKEKPENRGKIFQENYDHLQHTHK